jgi:hypothetical protein
MLESKVLGVAAGLVTVAAWAALWVANQGGFGPTINSKPHEASGWMLARQALELLQPGAPLVVITRDTTAFKNPASDFQLAGFKNTLRQAGVTISKLQALQVDPLRPVEVPPGDFFELIRNTPKGGVIVSFMGPPLLSELQRKQLGEVKPSILAFCSGSLADSVDLRTLFDQGLLQRAIVSRTNVLRAPDASPDLQRWFDQSFVVITASNHASLLPDPDARAVSSRP